MRGDADPGPVALLPVVGIPAASLLTVDGSVDRRRVDDRDVPENANPDVFAGEPIERPRSGGAGQELCLVQELAGRSRTLEVVGKQLPEALDVAGADRVQVRLVEVAQ